MRWPLFFESTLPPWSPAKKGKDPWLNYGVARPPDVSRKKCPRVIVEIISNSGPTGARRRFFLFLILSWRKTMKAIVVS